MQKLASILCAICLGLLLVANIYRLPVMAKSDSADMESVVNLGDTEEVKNTVDPHTFMEEQALHDYTAALLMPEEKAAFYIRHTTELPWQHTETLLLPPEFSSLS